jgi:hypothetical protein
VALEATVTATARSESTGDPRSAVSPQPATAAGRPAAARPASPAVARFTGGADTERPRISTAASPEPSSDAYPG